MRRLVFSFILGLAAAGSTAPASAMPVFAHRYGFSCQQCHTTVPTLNAFGRYFQRRGFRLDAPARGTFPVAAKVQVTYASSADPGLPKAVVDEVELLSAGSIGRNAHYYLEQYVVDGGRLGRSRDMWVAFDRGPFHAKVGQFTLPLPLDPETQRPTLAHYAVFDQTVGENEFSFFDARDGADLSYANDRGGGEAHLALTRGGVMGTLSQTLGDDLTAYAYRFAGGGFARQGYGLGYDRSRLSVRAIIQRGSDAHAGDAGAGVASSGGLLQAAWTFDPRAAFVARYDATYDDVAGRAHALTGSLVLRPANRVRLTIEGTRAGGASQLGLGAMFAF